MRANAAVLVLRVKLVQGKYLVSNYNAVSRYALMALKGILVVQSEHGDISLISTYDIEKGDFPSGKLLSFKKLAEEPLDNLELAIAEICIQQGHCYFAVRSDNVVHSINIYQLSNITPNRGEYGSFFKSFALRFPMYFCLFDRFLLALVVVLIYNLCKTKFKRDNTNREDLRNSKYQSVAGSMA